MPDDQAVAAPAVAPLRSRRALGFLAYGAMIAFIVQAFRVIRETGERWFASAESAVVHGASEPSSTTAGHNATLLHLLIALVAIVIASRLIGGIFRYLHQPPVIGEVLAGILLGPSFLGAISPTTYALLLPPGVAVHLGMLAQVGVILYMFLVGVELDTSTLRNKTHATMAISHASIGLPFILGALAALWLYPAFSNAATPFGVFAMFLGVSMSVTAFPVLARILTDRGINRTTLGVIALSCAAVDDITAWCLLALLVGAAQASMQAVVTTLGGSALFLAVMLLFVRPWMHSIIRTQELRRQVSRSALAMLFVAILAAASITEYVGIHGVFGAFLLGCIVPHDSLLATQVKDKLEDVVLLLLLPAFFALTGMRTQLSLISGSTAWLACIVIIVVACVGKIAGSALAARIAGMNWRDSMSLGVLMNTRGLMELIVLNIGLELGVISPQLFAMMVIMALVTTFATTPLLALLNRGDAASVDVEPELAR